MYGQLDRILQWTGPDMNGHWHSAGHVLDNLRGSISLALDEGEQRTG